MYRMGKVRSQENAVSGLDLESGKFIPLLYPLQYLAKFN